MSVEIAKELWSELKRYVNTVDRSEAADTIISVLIDHDCDVEDIRNTFKGDTDIKRALASYIDNDKNYEEEEESEDEEDFEDFDPQDWED